MYKPDLALNNLQGLICRKTQINKIIYIIYIVQTIVFIFIAMFITFWL